MSVMLLPRMKHQPSSKQRCDASTPVAVIDGEHCVVAQCVAEQAVVVQRLRRTDDHEAHVRVSLDAALGAQQPVKAADHLQQAGGSDAGQPDAEAGYRGCCAQP